MDRMTPFTLHCPRSLEDALRLQSSHAGARFIAGGTDLVANLRRRIGETGALIDICGLPELRAFAIERHGAATIGAGITLARLAVDATVARVLPALAEAARAVAGPAHRSVATVGGNLCLDTRCVFYNQSEWWRSANAFCLKHRGDTCHVAPQGARCHAAFSGDLAPALLVLGAEVAIAGPGTMRRMPLAALYSGDGAAPLTLGASEIIVAAQLPEQPAQSRSGYRKATARGAMDFPLAGVAARVATDAQGRLVSLAVALTGTNPRAFLLDGTEALLGQIVDDPALARLGKLVQKQASPMRTTVTAADYRRQVASVLAQRLVRELAAAT